MKRLPFRAMALAIVLALGIDMVGQAYACAAGANQTARPASRQADEGAAQDDLLALAELLLLGLVLADGSIGVQNK